MNISCDFSVPDEPRALKVIVYGTEKVLVRWHPPLSEESGPILYYTIYYRKPGGEAKTGNAVAYKNSYEIFGLEPNESYEIWVKAATKVGEGQASEYITVKPGNETPPQIATYENRFTVQFKENVTLPCDAVGAPNLNVTWKVRSIQFKLN